MLTLQSELSSDACAVRLPYDTTHIRAGLVMHIKYSA